MKRSSFDDAEIFEHIGDQTGGRREFFGSDGYSFRRLGKVEELDPKLVEALRMRRWKLAHPERCAELKRKSIEQRMRVDPVGQRAMCQRRKKKWEAKNRAKVLAQGRARHHRTKSAETKRRALARAKAHYAAVKADGARLEALRKYKREWAREKAKRAAPPTPTGEKR